MLLIIYETGEFSSFNGNKSELILSQKSHERRFVSTVTLIPKNFRHMIDYFGKISDRVKDTANERIKQKFRLFWAITKWEKVNKRPWLYLWWLSLNIMSYNDTIRRARRPWTHQRFHYYDVWRLTAKTNHLLSLWRIKRGLNGFWLLSYQILNDDKSSDRQNFRTFKSSDGKILGFKICPKFLPSEILEVDVRMDWGRIFLVTLENQSHLDPFSIRCRVNAMKLYLYHAVKIRISWVHIFFSRVNGILRSFFSLCFYLLHWVFFMIRTFHENAYIFVEIRYY